MNEKDRQFKRNQIRRLFRHQSGIHTNCVRISTANTFHHELMKFKVCWMLKGQGHDFITEAETPDKKQRCDVVDLDDGRIIEIAVSENEASLIKKNKDYPLPITIVRWAEGAADNYKPMEAKKC